MGNPAAVINADLFCSGALEVADVMLVAIVWALGVPVLLTVIEVSSQRAPAKTD